METQGSTVRRRRLGAEMRALRERAGLDQSDAAKELECSTSKISRLEKGQGRVSFKAMEMDRLLALYGADDVEKAKMHEIRRAASELGWWEQAQYEEVLPSGLGVYVGLEYAARQVQAWEPLLVPGLLQTPQYARAVFGEAPDTDRQVDIRLKRQERLTDPDNPLELWAIIDEFALRRPMGGPEVMREQVAVLAEAAARPNVTIQIFPADKPHHPGLVGAFSILNFGPSDPQVGYVDSFAGNSFLERDSQIVALTHVFSLLKAGALDIPESAALLHTLAAA
ncbi:helix-turn-helix domain-containing protein [Streptomyces sp. WZ-12]|uniref:helix-turn-helix domain-containing protein n=1 Tax=Streptomyces sp. WZ-12 TaxID=3030210 RepID=UPI002380EA9B|nr:helix-turn-helix transcriptional regulator [Streptomyces sp. WZ-12]